MKEQSPCPSVLLAQTKLEGLSPRVMSEPIKHKGKGIVPIITRVYVFVWLRRFPIGWGGLAGFVEWSRQSIAKESLAMGFCWLTKHGKILWSEATKHALAPTYDFVKFSQKLHEIEKILGPRGARPGGASWIRHCSHLQGHLQVGHGLLEYG